MYTIKRRDFITFLGSAAMVMPAPVQAARSFPNRPIRLVVPYPPGRGPNIVARVLRWPAKRV